MKVGRYPNRLTPTISGAPILSQIQRVQANKPIIVIALRDQLNADWQIVRPAMGR